MDSNKPQTRSQEELMQLLERQKRQNEELLAALEALNARVESFEAWLAQLCRVKQQQKQERALRDALRHLDNTEYLARSRLAEMVARLCGYSPDGDELKRCLTQAIVSLKPKEGLRYQIPQYRYYDVLRLTYLEKKGAGEVAQTLSISKRQYFRDLKAAIQRVADQLPEFEL